MKEASEATAALQQLGPGGAQQAAAAGAAAAAAAQGATPMAEVTFNFDAAMQAQQAALQAQQEQQAQQAQQEQYLQYQQQQQQYQQQAAAQQAAQQQQPPQQAAPAEAGPTMTVVYETGWGSAYLHFNAGGLSLREQVLQWHCCDAVWFCLWRDAGWGLATCRACAASGTYATCCTALASP